MIDPGNKAADFCLVSEDGDPVCLKDLKGQWVILYFYPKDNTSG
jgi:peroxiredoxin Q/BCP